MDSNETNLKDDKTPGLKDILFMPLGCLLQLANPFVMVFLVIVIGGLSWLLFFSQSPIKSIYYSTSDLEFTEGFGSITTTNGDKEWKIQYEFASNTTFSGFVRHNTAINESVFPMLSHDILITTGDYANKSLVNTSVSNHHFKWVVLTDKYPTGNINLLHTVPLNHEIYQLLGSIEVGDEVLIEGREIYKIDFYNKGEKSSFWSDSGCNTLVVTKVIINNQ